MNVLIRSSQGIQTVPMDSYMLNKRRIFIDRTIDAELAVDFARQILQLNDESDSEPIDVIINSVGGEINAGMLMYDVIQSSKAPIRMFCAGKAYSMAAVLFACGNNGRYMLPHSELMLHEPLLGGSISGNSSSIKSISDSLLETRKKMNKIIAKHTGKTEKQVAKATEYDHYFTPEESIAFGLCDEIVEFSKLMEG